MRLIDLHHLLQLVKKNAPFIYSILLPIAMLCPTIEAEPVRHGEWIEMVFTDTETFAGYKCSECGLGARKKFSYCHCGAKMDGGKKDVH